MQAVPSYLWVFEDWETVRGGVGYDLGARHITGVKKLKSSTREDMGIHVIYSGTSLRRIEEHYKMDLVDLLRFHRLKGDKVARLDVAIDLINTGVAVDDFVRDYHEKRVRTLTKQGTVIKGLDSDDYTFYIGSRKARKKLLRIYNKAAEQKIEGDWIRVELQVMGKPATNLADILVKSDNVGRVSKA